MTQTSVTIQVNPESVPSTPLWMGEVAAVAQVLTHVGLLKAIQEHVQFARARFGQYDTMDFVVVLLGYALSGEATLQSFYERLAPFAAVFMALFGRHRLPSRSALSRFLAALDQASVGTAHAVSGRPVATNASFPVPWRVVGSLRSAVRGRGCGRDQTGGSPTSPSPPSIASIASSSF